MHTSLPRGCSTYITVWFRTIGHKNKSLFRKTWLNFRQKVVFVYNCYINKLYLHRFAFQFLCVSPRGINSKVQFYQELSQNHQRADNIYTMLYNLEYVSVIAGRIHHNHQYVF